MCDRRHFLRMSIVALGAAGVAGSALAAADPAAPKKVYVCPPCGCAADGKEFPEPGTCPECGMTLVEKPAAAPKLSFRQPAGADAWRAPVKAAAAGPVRGRAKAAIRLTT